MTADALRFFSRLEAYLNAKLPGPDAMTAEVNEIVRTARASGNQPHKTYSEGAFLNHYITPKIRDFLIEQERLSPADAVTALLSESHENLEGIASGSPAREKDHPFTKALGTTAQDIARRWTGQTKKKKLLVQSCPDLALRAPFAHKTVIEGKLWRSGGRPMAMTGLVHDLYQAFFYRGLPHIPGSWEYDYACLLAFDATPNGTLRGAWESLHGSVRDGFWEGANVYVMILRGQA